MDIEEDFVPRPKMGEAAMRERHNVMLECARLVCSWCAGNSYPSEKQCHQVTGPNSAGNYTHQPPPGGRAPTLCAASPIWARIRWEKG